MVTRLFVDGAETDDAADLQKTFVLIEADVLLAAVERRNVRNVVIDCGVVQFYNADGEMLHTVNLFNDLQPQRVAA